MRKTITRFLLLCATAAGSLSFTAGLTTAATGQSFQTAKAAVEALAAAIETRSDHRLAQILGDDWRSVLPIRDIDEQDIERFLAAWAEWHVIEYRTLDDADLLIGHEEWHLPIPIVRQADGWRFDTQAGRDEMLTRRIGRNELAAIEACRAYFDAQREYALIDRNEDGVLEYAQRLIGTPGRQDGLYWAELPDERESPLGPFFGDGTPGDDYHGYHFRILSAQGDHAPGGAYDYRIGSRLVGGFALIAWPSSFGDTGVMSFQISHNGQVYQKNLGPDSDRVARTLSRFLPDDGWEEVKTH